jgi:phosphoglycerate dehydrogenase-like enzyme
VIPSTGDPDGTIPRAWYSGTSKASLHTFLSSGLDALIIALPLTPSTRNLFSTEEFSILSTSNPPSSEPHKKSRSAFLINIARGGLIDQPALVKALNDDVLLGAALDVATPEPLPEDDPLWEAKNVIITPHVSALGTEYGDRAYDLFMENWARQEKGEKMFNVVDRKKGY